MLRTIEPWLPAGVQGRAMKVVVAVVIVKLCLLVVGGLILLILFATGVM